MAEQEHYGDLTLRRYFIGELKESSPDEEMSAHLADCAVCRARIEALVAEERDFQAGTNFETFAKGVEAKLAAPAAPTLTRLWLAPLFAVAAAAAVIGIVALLARPAPGIPARIELHVVGAAGQRPARPREPLAEGERIRIAYRPGAWAYLAVVSVDEEGEVSALYPEAGESLPAGGGPGQTRMLPHSVGFLGPGLERIVVVFSAEPLSLERLREASRAAFEAAGGDVDRMGELPLEVPSEQLHRLVIKP